MVMRIGRRGCLAGMALAPVLAGAARAAVPTRIVPLEWSSAEMLLALGVRPAAIAEAEGYATWVAAPPLPDGIPDIGLRREPNLELLADLQPDLILTTPGYEAIFDRLDLIAPTMPIALYTGEGHPYDAAQRETRRLAALLGREAEAEAVIADLDAAISEARGRLAGYDGRPVWVAFLAGSRHATVFGTNSLFQGVLDRLGLRNAWSRDGSPWGTVTVGIEAFAAEPDARLVYFDRRGGATTKAIGASPLWQSLPFVHDRRMAALPPIWFYGGVPSAARFARAIGQALADR